MSILLLCIFYLCFSVKIQADFPFRNVSLPWNERVDDLVSRLSLDEVILQLSRGGTSPGGGPAPAIPRLKIFPWSWNTECLHGVSDGKATAFPQSIGLAATFNKKIIYKMAEAISKEARAKYNNNTRHFIYGNQKGINCFSPVVNVMRHPLWGRNEETYGEDPYLISQLSQMFVRGLHGAVSKRYIRATATCKHFDVHSGPESIPQSRFTFNAKVNQRDWRLTYLPAFYGCIVEGGAASVMCSYNEINGIPACAHKHLLTDILKHEWNFTGFIISDQDALENIVDTHKYLNTYEQAAAAALLAGVNLGLSSNNPRSVFTYLPQAINLGLVTEFDVINAVRPLFLTRMKLGEFDPPVMNPYSHYPLDIVQSKEHKQLATQAAMESFVLLQNKNNTLPLKSRKLNSIAVVGPMADNGAKLSGNYAPPYDPSVTITPLEGLSPLGENVHFAKGCSNVLCEYYNETEIRIAIANAELIVVCLGTGIDVEKEGLDRSHLTLPGKQDRLLQDVVQFHGNARVILVLINASPVISDQFPHVDVILECFYPAQQTGEALFKVLVGDYNPAGRLPYTWPRSLDQVPDMTLYSMANRTYRYWNHSSSPLFPFGFGLSYTKFSYSHLKLVHPNPRVGDNVTFFVTISNEGGFDGDEVIQAYISWIDSPQPMPKLQLVGFDRVHIESGSQIEWQCVITSDQLAVYLEDQGFRVIPGDFHLFVGGQQPFQSVSTLSNVLQTKFTLSA